MLYLYIVKQATKKAEVMKKIEILDSKVAALREAGSTIEALRRLIDGEARRASELRDLGVTAESDADADAIRGALLRAERERDRLEGEVAALKQEVAANYAAEAEDLVEGISEGAAAALYSGEGATVEGRRGLSRRLADASFAARAEADALRRVAREYDADKYDAASEWLNEAADALM